MENDIVILDSVEKFNRHCGFETLHPLVSIVDMSQSKNDFGRHLNTYFKEGLAARKGFPTVAYFADKLCLSTGYFDDLIKKETGLTAQRYIQNKVIDLSKQYVMDHELTINQVAYKLGFQYPQHFTRLFKKEVGMTPSEYRN